MTNSTLLNHTDINQLAADMGDMAGEIIPDLINSLENDFERSLQEMHQAIEQSNGEILRQAAHRLKSSCANLGAATAASLCLELELTANQENIQHLAPMIDRLDNLCRESIIELRNLTF